MSIPDHARANFQRLLRAATSADLAPMECTEIATGDPLRHPRRRAMTATIVFTPIGHLADGNPFELYRPLEAST